MVSINLEGFTNNAQIYVKGITDHIIRNENVADYIVNFVQKEIEQRKNNQLK